MAKRIYTIHARERVLEFIDAKDLDRLAQAACDAAEKSANWKKGEEFIYEIEEEPYVYPGHELSALIVIYESKSYEIRFYYGLMAETISDVCSWDRYSQE